MNVWLTEFLFKCTTYLCLQKKFAVNHVKLCFVENCIDLRSVNLFKAWRHVCLHSRIDSTLVFLENSSQPLCVMELDNSSFCPAEDSMDPYPKLSLTSQMCHLFPPCSIANYYTIKKQINFNVWHYQEFLMLKWECHESKKVENHFTKRIL